MGPSGSVLDPRITTLDTTKFFDNSDNSDLIVRFSGRAITAHKFVLCAQSEYFNKMCDSTSNFKEASAKEITLHNDENPDAVEEVLRFLYGLNYRGSSTRSARGRAAAHCSVAIAADNYGVQALVKLAQHGLVFEVRDFIQPVDVMSTLKLCLTDSGLHPALAEPVDRILDHHLSDLADTEEWIEWVVDVPEIVRKVSRQAGRLREMKRTLGVQVCVDCNNIRLEDRREGICECGWDMEFRQADASLFTHAKDEIESGH